MPFPFLVSFHFCERWIGGVTVKVLDIRSKSCEFDSQSGCHQVLTTWMGDCGQVNHLDI